MTASRPRAVVGFILAFVLAFVPSTAKPEDQRRRRLAVAAYVLHVLATPLRRVTGDFRTSYLLSYTPSNIDSGWHEITVRVRNKRYNIRARKGYEGG